MKRFIKKLTTTLSLKDVLISKAYYSSTMYSLSQEFAEDVPYNVFTSLYNEIENKINNIHNPFVGEHLLLWVCITLFCTGCLIIEKNNKLHLLIDYEQIKHHTNQIIFIIIFVLFKNVENAI